MGRLRRRMKTIRSPLSPPFRTSALPSGMPKSGPSGFLASQPQRMATFGWKADKGRTALRVPNLPWMKLFRVLFARW